MREIYHVSRERNKGWRKIAQLAVAWGFGIKVVTSECDHHSSRDVPSIISSYRLPSRFFNQCGRNAE